MARTHGGLGACRAICGCRLLVPHSVCGVGDTGGEAADGPTATQLGLGAGWADIYGYSLDGNYVEFGTNGDGRYVVRSVADANNDILESDERDNAGYAYIEIAGTQIRVLERGHGMSPWDPHKFRADDLLPPNA